MDNIIGISLDEVSVKQHELKIIMEHTPDFLPPVTFTQTNERETLLYTIDGLVPFADYYDARKGRLTLCRLFELVCGYIRCILFARDRLLDTRLLSSDPKQGVFVSRQTDTTSGSGEEISVKAIWGFDALEDDREKICRIAETFAGCERIMGAKISMERMISIIRSERLSVKDCLKVAEGLCREWNQIL